MSVEQARTRQIQRQNCTNAQLSQQQLNDVCPLPLELSQLLEEALDKLGLSARAYHRIIKVARTIADLNGTVQIEKAHILEALSYRQMERRLQS